MKSGDVVDLMFDEVIIDEIAGDITLWTKFYIISDEQSFSLVEDFQNRLDELKISSFIICDNLKYDFEDWDCLLAISRTGEDESILNEVVLAKSRNVRVYGVCADLKSDLAQSCDECIPIGNSDFKEDTQEFLGMVLEKVESQLEDEEYDVKKASYLGPSKVLFIVSDYELIPYAKKIGKDFSLMLYSISIVTEGMEGIFKDKLKKEDSIIALSNHDDGFVVDMVKFAKSKDMFVLGSGFVYCENFIQLCDSFNPLDLDDARKCGIDISGFQEIEAKNDEISQNEGNMSGIKLVALFLMIIVIMIVCLVIFR